MNTPEKHSGAPSAERWVAIEAAFAQAASLTGDARIAVLRALDRDDATLAAEVRSLLVASEPWWLDNSVVEMPSTMDAMPERIGPYRLVRQLGRGGMGEVWLALREDADFRQHVALKIVRSGLETTELMAAFRAERQILASLNHPNIAHLLDVGQTPEGRPYLALEFVEGLPLNEYCDQNKLTVDERLKIFCTICYAVKFAHQNLVVHQDLKPSNIIVSATGVPKLLDYGIAKVLSPTSASGGNLDGVPMATPDAMTPEYAAPGQIEGAATTTASDVYALGVVLYQLLTGQLPYASGGKRGAMLERIREAPPRAPSLAVEGAQRSRLAGDLDAIVLRALGRTVGERYSSVEQFAADIERSLSSHPVSVRAHTVGYIAASLVHRHRLCGRCGTQSRGEPQTAGVEHGTDDSHKRPHTSRSTS